ncbi:MAG: PepSY domain-containing protein [Pyrobaculum sp.]
MNNKNIPKKAVISIIILATVSAVAIAYAMWYVPSYMGGMMGPGGMMSWGYQGGPVGAPTSWWGGPMMGSMMAGGCPMAGWWYGPVLVNDTNVVEYVKSYGDVISVEKYSNGYYVIVGVGGVPQWELLVFPNGFVHPEPQSMMWRGAPMRISEEEARKIAEGWLARYFPGAEIEEVYVFPGYYTFHFKIGDDMQMLSVNGYSGAVWFHSWHGRYIGEVSH